MQDLFLTEAVKYSVLPLDDRILERMNAALGGPARSDGRPHVANCYPGHDRDVRKCLHQREEPVAHDHRRGRDSEGRANGVMLAQAGRFGGWSLYVKDGKPTYTYNWLGLKQYTVAGNEALPAGKATIRFEFAYDGGGVGKGGTGTLFVNGKKVAEGRIEQTQCCVFSADEGADVGADEGTPVSEAYTVPFKFTGQINRVTIELKEMTPATANASDKARRQAALKKGLSN